jgi:hypothetical protein
MAKTSGYLSFECGEGGRDGMGWGEGGRNHARRESRPPAACAACAAHGECLVFAARRVTVRERPPSAVLTRAMDSPGFALRFPRSNRPAAGAQASCVRPQRRRAHAKLGGKIGGVARRVFFDDRPHARPKAFSPPPTLWMQAPRPMQTHLMGYIVYRSSLGSSSGSTGAASAALVVVALPLVCCCLSCPSTAAAVARPGRAGRGLSAPPSTATARRSGGDGGKTRPRRARVGEEAGDGPLAEATSALALARGGDAPAAAGGASRPGAGVSGGAPTLSAASAAVVVAVDCC